MSKGRPGAMVGCWGEGSGGSGGGLNGWVFTAPPHYGLLPPTTHHSPLHHCHEIMCAPRMRAVAWAAQWAVERQLQLTSAHRKTAVEVDEVGVGSDLGHVPLHGALGVSRGALLLYCSQT